MSCGYGCTGNPSKSFHKYKKHCIHYSVSERRYFVTYYSIDLKKTLKWMHNRKQRLYHKKVTREELIWMNMD